MILVIFLFLRNVSATLIPSLALPMSIIGTFAVMSLLGYSVDNLSLMALTLSVGFVVDDAIVMLENIVRHMEMGKPPHGRRRSKGRAEIGFTILSMTLSLAAVFIPVLFMSGLMGRLFHEFAVTIMRCDPDLGVCLAQLDAHAVQPFPEARRRAPQCFLQDLGEVFRRLARPVRRGVCGACCGIGSRPCSWPRAPWRPPVYLYRHRSQGFHPQPGYRAI